MLLALLQRQCLGQRHDKSKVEKTTGLRTTSARDSFASHVPTALLSASKRSLAVMRSAFPEVALLAGLEQDLQEQISNGVMTQKLRRG